MDDINERADETDAVQDAMGDLERAGSRRERDDDFDLDAELSIFEADFSSQEVSADNDAVSDETEEKKGGSDDIKIAEDF